MAPRLELFPVLKVRNIVDPHFVVALCLGPLVWVLLLVFTNGAGVTLSALLLLNVVLLYPLLEELAFRGFVQGWLLEKKTFTRQIGGISAANLLTSIVFALAHLFNQPPLWAAAIFFPSIVFGYFRDRHQSVLTPFLLHAWYNAGFFVVLQG